MFDIGWTELVVLGLVILIVLGPSEIPTVLRWIGRITGQIRRVALEFQRNLASMDHLTSGDPFADSHPPKNRSDGPKAGSGQRTVAPPKSETDQTPLEGDLFASMPDISDALSDPISGSEKRSASRSGKGPKKTSRVASKVKNEGS